MTTKLFVFWILIEAKLHSRGGRTEGWDHPAAAPFSLSHSHLIPSFPLLFILQLQSCAPLSQSLTLSYKVSLSLSHSLSICPWDTKMDGEAPGMGRTIGCATRWAASAAYGPVLPFLAPARLLTQLEYVCVKGGLSGTVWQQMLLFGQKSERGLGWGA